MKQAEVYSVGGSKIGKLDLPSQFEEKIRKDLIKRAVLAIQSHNYQPYGSDPLAGKRQGYTTSKRRRRYRGTYGHSRSRVRRKHIWHRGSQFGWIGAFVANVRGGRKAFPPQVDKNFEQKINKKERRLAIRSAIAAARSFVVEDKLETFAKTSEVQKVLTKLNLKAELDKSKNRTIRSGIGKLRGRKYKQRKGPLFVVSKDCKLVKSTSNLPGADSVVVKNLNAELLAPGTNPGRLTIWSKGAIELLKKEELFN